MLARETLGKVFTIRGTGSIRVCVCVCNASCRTLCIPPSLLTPSVSQLISDQQPPAAGSLSLSALASLLDFPSLPRGSGLPELQEGVG